MKDRVDSVRGIACMCVVYFHVVGDGSTGLKLDSNHIYSMISDFLLYIRMPLFTFLSGYVYAYRRFDGEGIPYLLGKSRRILLPFIFVSTIFAVIQFNTPGTNKTFDHELWTFFLYPFAHFWFLQSIFTIFILVASLDYISNKNNKVLWLALLASIPLFFYSSLFTDFFSFSRTLYLLPFFLLGMLANTHHLEELNIKLAISIFCLFVILLVLHAFNLYTGIPLNRLSLLSFLIGGIGSLLLLRFSFSNKFLMYIGGFSYSIYLFHVFGTASSRMFLNKLNIESISIHILVGLFVGIFLPIVMHLVIKRFSILRPMLLGLKSKG